ncbi:hypothetical protein [Paenibacillus sp. MDMC362]|uniref:hypothetical protein n=1 Tax=Paenibacillus sp. MDMC362 TaxID=2977365 RepID=UPI000DC3CF39|nr:hypothetical protein [Paenibacillus sp. MDMC362]RAR44584.1 hypothetical protein DP091_07355 [Paenibacillus sp. MDMC362]
MGSEGNRGQKGKKGFASNVLVIQSHEEGLTVNEEDIAILRQLIAAVDGCAETESPAVFFRRVSLDRAAS